MLPEYAALPGSEPRPLHGVAAAERGDQAAAARRPSCRALGAGSALLVLAAVAAVPCSANTQIGRRAHTRTHSNAARQRMAIDLYIFQPTARRRLGQYRCVQISKRPVCVRVCACVCARVHACARARMRVCVCGWVRTCERAYRRVCEIASD